MKETNYSPLSHKLLLLYQFIAILRAGRWTIKQLTNRFECGKTKVYRFIKLIEEAGFCIEKDFHNRYFILTTEDDPIQAQFTEEEISMVRAFLQTDMHHPLKNSILKKLSLKPELDAMPQLFLKAHLGHLVEQLTNALRARHQIILKNYFSANSTEMRDRLVEPFQFGDNYTTLIALDVEEKICKQFKIDRIGEVIETHKAFQHEDLHKSPYRDLFGLSGNHFITVTLNLSARAYLLLREEFPLTVSYLSDENGTYRFSGPVAHYAGIGRFVMGLIDEIEIVEPDEFKEYVRKKLERK